jgi:hypothetical protein
LSGGFGFAFRHGLFALLKSLISGVIAAAKTEFRGARSAIIGLGHIKAALRCLSTQQDHSGVEYDPV